MEGYVPVQFMNREIRRGVFSVPGDLLARGNKHLPPAFLTTPASAVFPCVTSQPIIEIE
jgi:hypothetical protein